LHPSNPTFNPICRVNVILVLAAMPQGVRSLVAIRILCARNEKGINVADETLLHEVREALERLIAGKATSNDEEFLRDTLLNNHYAIAVGERAVAISGNANDAIIITGDRNVVHVFKGLDDNALDTISRLVREALVLPTLLTPE